ncbi:hypothetical protein GQX73_g5356 [Xylaria multiplex]|uniref:Polyketide synthase-like phosphopantetheine-binding domain-containing protein n=1 Tax=Xylaria multiplex TaxID=323545 RepID=A0A7C8ING6_9PEZI|nr:hypothetical protein GQX73_g5356 [Xylaria multiplex]
MVLRDGAALDLTFDDWTAAIAPKVQGGWNLHNAFVQRAETLDFFVRRDSGLPAAVLGLCAADDAGFVADNPIIRRKLQAQGVHFLPEKQILDYFEFALLNQLDRDTPSEDEKGFLRPRVNHGYTIVGLHSEVPLDDPRCPTVWRWNRKMSMYHNIRAVSGGADGDSSSDLKAFLERAGADGNPVRFLLNEANVNYLATEIGTRIFHFMMRDATDLDISASISAIGMDSLMAIELRRWWKQIFAVDVTIIALITVFKDEAAAQALTENANLKGTVSAIQLDVTDDDSVDAAAFFLRSESRYVAQEIFATNVVGYVSVTEASIPLMCEAPAPRIVFLSSSLSELVHASDPSSQYYSLLGTEYRAATTARNMLVNQY